MKKKQKSIYILQIYEKFIDYSDNWEGMESKKLVHAEEIDKEMADVLDDLDIKPEKVTLGKYDYLYYKVDKVDITVEKTDSNNNSVSWRNAYFLADKNGRKNNKN